MAISFQSEPTSPQTLGNELSWTITGNNVGANFNSGSWSGGFGSPFISDTYINSEFVDGANRFAQINGTSIGTGDVYRVKGRYIEGDRCYSYIFANLTAGTDALFINNTASETYRIALWDNGTLTDIPLGGGAREPEDYWDITVTVGASDLTVDINIYRADGTVKVDAVEVIPISAPTKSACKWGFGGYDCGVILEYAELNGVKYGYDRVIYQVKKDGVAEGGSVRANYSTFNYTPLTTGSYTLMVLHDGDTIESSVVLVEPQPIEPCYLVTGIVVYPRVGDDWTVESPFLGEYLDTGDTAFVIPKSYDLSNLVYDTNWKLTQTQGTKLGKIGNSFALMEKVRASTSAEDKTSSGIGGIGRLNSVTFSILRSRADTYALLGCPVEIVLMTELDYTVQFSGYIFSAVPNQDFISVTCRGEFANSEGVVTVSGTERVFGGKDRYV